MKSSGAERDSRNGGVQRARGGQYQDYSLLYYILLRLADHPQLVATIEAVEDATIRYEVNPGVACNQAGTTATVITELIQCKKRERLVGSAQAGFTEDDPWIQGHFTRSDLEQWIANDRGSTSILTALASDNSLFYTALLFGSVDGTLEKFTPSTLRDLLPLDYPFPSRRAQFPVDFPHENDPFESEEARHGNTSARCRVRLIRTVSPKALETNCAILLRQDQAFRVVDSRVFEIVEKLWRLIAEASTVQGTITGGELHAIIAAGRAGQGRWVSGPDTLRRGTETGARLERGEQFRWVDFQRGRFADRPEFQAAQDGVNAPGALVVISGAVGTGKTSLCRRLLYEFHSQASTRSTFYLAVRPEWTLAEEILFLKSNLQLDALFIVDDEHLDPEAVEELILTFQDAQLETSPKARLVISTKVNYGRAGGLAQGRKSGLLRDAVLISLPNRDRASLTALLTQARSRGCFNSSLPDDELASLGDGVFGVAMLVAWVNSARPLGRTLQGLLRSQAFRDGLRTWILMQLSGKWGLEEFDTQILPVFILGAFNLPIPERYLDALPELERAGLISETRPPIGIQTAYHVENSNIAFQLQVQYTQRIPSIIQQYLDTYPAWTPLVLARLSEWPETHDQLLPDFIRRNLDAITEMVTGSELRLADITTILSVIYRFDRQAAITVYRNWILPRGRRNPGFADSILLRSTTAPELNRALEICRRLDQSVGVLVDVLQNQIDDVHLERIEELITYPESHIDQTGALLLQIWYIDRALAVELNDLLVESECFRRLIDGLETDDRGLLALLRYFQLVKRFDRLRVYQFIEHRLRCDDTARRLLSRSATSYPLSRFLIRLRSVHPLQSTLALQSAWDTHSRQLVKATSVESDLDAVIQTLFALSQCHRRVSIQIASLLIDRLAQLIEGEQKYVVVGAGLNRIRRHISRKVATSVAELVDIERVRRLLASETRYADTIGRFLIQLAEVCPDSAEQIVVGLDYRDVMRRCRLPRLRDVTLLITGFMRASGPEQQRPLLHGMLHDTALVGLFSSRWRDAGTASELTFCVINLQSAGVIGSDLLRLLGEPGPEEVIDRFASLIRPGTPLLHVSNGLLGLARFDLGAATETLEEYLRALEEPSISNPGRRRRAGGTEGGEPGLAGSRNLVEIGCLLHIASAIDARLARRLVSRLDVSWTVAAAAGEANLGRLVVFLGGMARASRSAAIKLLHELSHQEVWRRQFEENESVENVGNYCRILRTISKRKAADFGEFIFSEFGDELLSQLRSEVNLSVIANWVRLVGRVPGDSQRGTVARLAETALEVVEYDGNLWHVIDGTEAFIEARDLPTARNLSRRISASRSQINAFDRPQEWVMAICRCLHIERALEERGLTALMLGSIRLSALERLVLDSGDLLTSAWMCFMMRSVNGLEGVLDARVLNELEQELQQRAMAQRVSVKCLLTLCFAQAPDGVLLEILNKVDWLAHSAWEAGLALLAFQINDRALCAQRLLGQVGEIETFFRPIPDDHTGALGNIGFALTVYLQSAAGRLRTNGELRRELSSRRDDEAAAAVNWLLSNYATASDVVKLPYYFWWYLRETVLRATYLPWEKEVEEMVDSVAFGHRHSGDLVSLAAS